MSSRRQWHPRIPEEQIPAAGTTTGRTAAITITTAGNSGGSGGGSSFDSGSSGYSAPTAAPEPAAPRVQPIMIAPRRVDPDEEAARQLYVQEQIEEQRLRLEEERKKDGTTEVVPDAEGKAIEKKVKVRAVTSGNSFVDTSGKRYLLSDVEAPLYSVNPRIPSAPGGEEAYIKLRDLIEGKEVTVRVAPGAEGEKRIPVQAWLDGKSVNELCLER